MPLSKIAIGTAYMLSAAFAVWLPCWAFGKKYQLDHRLDRTAQTIRWFSVALCLILIAFRIVPPGNAAAALGLIFLAFFAWPNLAFYLSQLLRRAGLVR